MNTIVISGASGLIGSALSEHFLREGHTVRPLVRHPAAADSNEIFWNPLGQHVDGKQLEGCQAVVHLAGENIASGRWTREKKGRILRSRVDGTRLLAKTLAGLKEKPSVFLCASAGGFYGDTEETAMDEDSPAGESFLAEVCQRWENAAHPAVEAGIRTVHLRLGMVLSPEGGALANMVPIFKWGLGGRLGSGRQWISWIALEDVVGVVQYILHNEALSGPVNLVSPEPVRQKAFARQLASALHRPALCPTPEFVLHLVLGEMANAVLLSSSRIQPAKLQQSGYAFREPNLQNYLERHLGKK